MDGIYECSDEGDGEKCGVLIDSSELTIRSTRASSFGVYSKYNMMDVKDSKLNINSKGYTLCFNNSQAYTRGINITGKSIVNLTSSNEEVVYTNIESTISNIDLTTGGRVTISSTDTSQYADASVWYGLVKIGENTVIKQGNEEEVTKPETPEYADAKLYEGTGTPTTLILASNVGFDIETTFADAAEGYEITAEPIIITALGGDRTIKSVSIDDETHFELTGAASVANELVTDGDSIDTVTIRPVAGLQYGNYQTTITVIDTEDIEHTAIVRFNVTSPVRANIASQEDYGEHYWIRDETILTFVDDVTFDMSKSLQLYADLTIDLNGHTISLDWGGLTFLYNRDCTVKIIDSSAGKTGKIVWVEGNDNQIEIFHNDAQCEEANLIIDGIKYEYPSNFYYNGVIRCDTAAENKTASILVKNSLFKIKGPVFGMNNMGDHLDHFTLKFEDTIVEPAEASASFGLVQNGGHKYGDLIDTDKYVILGDGVPFDNNALVESYGTSFGRFEIKKRNAFEVTAPLFDDEFGYDYEYSVVTPETINITAIGSNRSIASVTVSGSDFVITPGTPGEVAQNATNSTYTIAPVTGLSVGTHTATITVTDTDEPANTYTATVTFVVSKTTPAYGAIPTGLTATYGQTLADVTLPTVTGIGSWTWKEASTTKVGDAGNQTHGVVFTPLDTTNYKTVDADVTIAVAKANQTFETTATNKIMEYDQTLNYPFTLSAGEGNITYSSNDTTYVEVDSTGTLTAKKVTTSPVTITVTAAETTNYNVATTTYTVTVTKAKLTKPTATTTTFTFDTSEKELDVNNVVSQIEKTTGDLTGTYVGSYSATYGLKDTTNYCWADDSSITPVTINWSITPVTSTLALKPFSGANISITKGQSIDLKTLLTLNPGAYLDDVEFEFEEGQEHDGGTIEGTELHTTSDPSTIMHMLASFVGKDLNDDGVLEYSPAEKYFSVTLHDKTSVTLSGLTYTNKAYDESAVEPTGTLTFTAGGSPVAGLTMADVDVIYTGRDGTTYSSTTAPINAGKYTVTYTIKNTNALYTGTVSYNFEITKVQIVKPTLEQTTFYYIAEAINVPVTNKPSEDLVTFWTTSTNDVFDNLKFKFEIIDKINYEWADKTTADVDLYFDIKPATPVITRNSESNKLTQGEELDLKTLVNIDPSRLMDQVTFAIDTLPTGVTLEDGILKTTTSAVVGLVTVRANFAGFNDDYDPVMEYNEAAEFTFDVEITKKPTSGGGGGSLIVTEYDIKLEANEGGSVVATPTKVEKGKNAKIKVTAYEGYEIEDVIVDGESVGAVEEYTIKNIKKDVTVKVAFKKIEVIDPDRNIDRFEDVKLNDWFYDAVKFVVENKLMNGTSETKFEPNATTTRAMIVTILYRIENEPNVSVNNIFDDVANDTWYSKAIAWASKNEIVLGMGDREFNPNGAITREQLVTILYRYANYKKMDTSIGEDTNILSYDDSFEISEYAMSAFQWACGEGIVSGVGENKLEPKENATRAQIATIIMRFIKNI